MSAWKSSPLNETQGQPWISSHAVVLPSSPLLQTRYVPPAAMVAPLANVKPIPPIPSDITDEGTPTAPAATLPDITAGERRCLNLVTHQYLARRGYRAAALAMRQEATAGQELDDWSPLGGEPARRLGSAGQQRCLVLALKLAELELVQQLSGVAPLLLLDDVLAELDPQRQHLLLEAIGEGHQCLVSATHLQSCVDDWKQRAQLVEIRAGSILASSS